MDEYGRALCVRGYHVYREIWEAAVGKKPLARRNGRLTMYNRYSASVRAETGRYASRHGVASAARYFSKKLDNFICKRSYGFVPPQRTCPSRSVALTYCP